MLTSRCMFQLMSLVGDLMKEMQKLKQENEQLKKDTQDLKASGDDMLKKLQELSDLYNLMNSQFNDLPNPDLFNSFVTWPGLEDALKGIRQELSDQTRPKSPMAQPAPSQRPVSAASSGKPESRPVSGHVSARGSVTSSRASTPGPSNELQEILEKLGKLGTEHKKLEGRVTTLEAKMKNKVDRDGLEGLGGHSDDLEKRIKGLEEQMSNMKRLREKSPSFQPTLTYTMSKEAPTLSPTKSAQSVPSLPKLHTPTTPRTPSPPLEPPDSKSGATMLVGTPVSIGNNVDLIYKDLVETLDQQNMLKAAIQKCREDIDMLLDKDPSLQQTLDRLNEMMKELEAKAAMSADGDKVVEHRLDDIDKLLESLQEMILSTTEPEQEQEPESEEVTLDATMMPTGDYDIDATKNFKNTLMENSAEIKNLKNRFRVMNKESNRQLHEAKDHLQKLGEDLHRMQRELQKMLNKSQSQQDSDALSRMQQAILQLQAELDRLSVSTQQLIDDNNNKQKDIDSLYKHCKKLEENKADKLYVQKEVDVKADKSHLDSKVNKSTFDTTLDDLNKLISDILGKLSGHEEEWKKALGQLSNDIDGKLDRLEFTPIREELERQLKMLSRKLKALDMGQYCEDDAAGIRKQLIQRFHCISCDRQVDMMPQPPMASIPNPAGMPGTRSARPYTVFELDQIRQQMRKRHVDHTDMSNYERAILARQLARLRMQDFRAFVVHFGKDMQAMSRGPMTFNQNQNQNQLDMADVYATSRACGGSHTTTFPHRRVTRVCNQGWKEEEVTVPAQLNNKYVFSYS
ncbi:hypothetical protein NP493_709g03015 [Ridgeia piscesae]|uniref:DUF4795 domain-containing protein n=1 Tax=Ridgeia piscesae TaxID=27915 RepID=A0AAD9KR11_RIDPI|nr:hypothetical protein NP493_709g03015 [Ridgeia piscesae]